MTTRLLHDIQYGYLSSTLSCNANAVFGLRQELTAGTKIAREPGDNGPLLGSNARLYPCANESPLKD